MNPAIVPAVVATIPLVLSNNVPPAPMLGPIPPLVLPIKTNCKKNPYATYIYREYKDANGQTIRKVLRVPCNHWNCVVCGATKRRTFRIGLEEVIFSKNLTTYITFTLDRVHCTALDSIRYIRKLWKNLQTYLKRHFGPKINFFLTLELQARSGFAHINVLIDQHVTGRDRAAIRKAWVALGGGSRLYVRAIKSTAKIARYITKDFAKGKLPGGTRRFSNSKGCGVKVRQSNHKWNLRNQLKVNSDLMGGNVRKVHTSHGNCESYESVITPTFSTTI